MGKNGRDAIIDAFWEALERYPYHAITARQLAGAAGVNKNTFYYHFSCVEDVAQAAVGEMDASPVPGMFIAGRGDTEDELAEVHKKAVDAGRIRHFRTLCGPNGIELVDIARESMMDTWIKSAHLTRDDFDTSELMILRFIVAGLFSLAREQAQSRAGESEYIDMMSIPFVRMALSYMGTLLAAKASSLEGLN